MMLNEVVVLFRLLARLAFFASRHQATLSSIQWKSAFVLTLKVTYPLSPLLVVLNAFDPTQLTARDITPRHLECRLAWRHLIPTSRDTIHIRWIAERQAHIAMPTAVVESWAIGEKKSDTFHESAGAYDR